MTEVVRMHGPSLDLSEFCQFMEQNRMVVVSDAVNDWKACRTWVQDDGTPNWPVLISEFGECPSLRLLLGHLEVPVASGGTYKTSKICFAELARQIQQDPACKLYLKDWHFTA